MSAQHIPKLLLPLFLGIAVLCLAGCQWTRPIPPQAVRGMIDLRGWDFNANGPADLVGEWEFFWQRHLSPADFSQTPPPTPSGYFYAPSFWTAYRLDGVQLPGTGYATYRLTILLNDSMAPLALKIEEISTAYAICIDRKPVAATGRAGLTPATTVPRQSPAIVAFQPASDRVEILLQVSNFHHRRGGLWDLITLGTETQIRRMDELRRGFDFFILGAIFSMAVYHLSLFAVRQKFRPTLYFGVVCLLVTLRLLTTDERHLLLFAPNIDWVALIKLEYLSYYLAVPAFTFLLKSLFPQLPRNLLRAVMVVGFGFSTVVLVTRPGVFTHTLIVYDLFTVGLFLYTFGLLLSAPVRRQVEAFVLLIGLLGLCLAVVNDILHVERIIRTGFFAPFGLLFFIFSQAFLVSFRLLRAFTMAETQRTELRDTLESLKQEVLDRIRVEGALRESEEKYRTILNSIQEGYYEVDLRGNMMFCNDSLCGIIGYGQDELIGMNNRAYMPPEAHKRVYETFLRVFNTGEPTKAFDWEVVTKGGAKKIVEASVTLIRDGKGVPLGFRGVVRDITERKKAEEQAKLHQQQLMQASKMAALGVLVSGVAHEINNPNNFIMLNAPIMRDAWQSAFPILEEYYHENGDFLMGGMKYSDMRQHMPKLLAGVADGAERIKQIVANLKTYVRGDAADLSQRVDVNAVIQSSISLISNVIKNATSHFSIRYGAGLPPVRGSFQRLEQVIINLIQNACQALADKNQGIFVSTGLDDTRNHIVIRVQDEGMGIPPEHLARIREPFFTTKQESGGLGLGVSISSRIVEEHGGAVRFTSQPGAGTTVEITLPCREDIAN
jgi:PAS domain S-box-containing protein